VERCDGRLIVPRFLFPIPPTQLETPQFRTWNGTTTVCSIQDLPLLTPSHFVVFLQDSPGFLIDRNQWWLTAPRHLYTFPLFFSAELGFGPSVIIRWCVYFSFPSILWLAPDSVIILQPETSYSRSVRKMDSSYSYFSYLLPVDHLCGFIPFFLLFSLPRAASH
jgi:hypothetical protein